MTHRVLLALRIISDKEIDRLAILHAGGASRLVSLLEAGPDSEVRLGAMILAVRASSSFGF